jgi:hypothetical protein
MTVFILQEKHNYESSPEVIGIYENEYDALLEKQKLEYEEGYTKYQITESEIIPTKLTKTEYENEIIKLEIEHEKALEEKNSKDLEEKIAECDKIREKYNKILENYKSKVTICEQNIYNAENLYLQNRDKMSTTEIRDIIEKNRKQISEEYRCFRDIIYYSRINSDISCSIWNLVDLATYELLY